MAAFSRTQLQDYKIIPMHNFDAHQFSVTHFGRGESCDATREFSSVEVTNPHDISGCELAFAS